MDLDGISLLGGEIDKSKVPPIEQKRILAFVNHFILTTCTFLNEFLTECDSKFITVERKLQKIEASLIILEEKLASIPDIDGQEPTKITENKSISPNINDPTLKNQTKSELPSVSTQKIEIVSEEITAPFEGIKASEDARYRKYFKMIQFGVPAPAVKLKMTTEGLDPEVLDTPNLILPDGIPYTQENS